MAVVNQPISAAPPAAPAAAAPDPGDVWAAEQPYQRVRVYVWQIPVRVTHWVSMGSVMLLSVTGAYIADPFLIQNDTRIMATVRSWHLLFAFVFLASGVLRTYWLFAGNQFSTWRAFVPTTRLHWLEFRKQGAWYLFIGKELPDILGHNALAGGTYFVVFFLFLAQTFTGFALAGAHGTQPWATLFGWLNDTGLGIQGVRLVHHLIMWLILGFMVHHVYSAVLVDHWEKNGLMSSIFGGYKFVTRRDIAEARDGGVRVQGVAEE